MTPLWKKTLMCAAIALLAACTGENPSRDHSVSDTGAADVGPSDSGADDAGRADGGPSDTSRADAGGDDASRADGGDTAADTTTDADPSDGRTLSDYRRCQTNLDCPVSLGTCVKDVALNRPDVDGRQTVPLGEIFPELSADEGICTHVCTTSPEVCSELSVNGTTGDPQPHTCQLVVVGQRPYPASTQPFPFDDQLDPAEQAAGQAFGAICRPPMGLDDEVSDAFCRPCSGPDSCGDSASLCWSPSTHDPVQADEDGLCLTPCDGDQGCPMGFVCDAADADANRYCRPMLDTCSACRDVDHDGFGTGRCGTSSSPVTADDCNDRNPDAYFDADQMDHAFPRTCGQQDYNCNGISDATEQVGAATYPDDHCEACFATCSGDIAGGHAGRNCQAGADDGEGVCMADCDTDSDGNLLYADCDGDIANGCEVAVDDPSRQYYRDADGDGFGDPDDVSFDCGNTGAPAGYVANADDCNDTSALAYPSTDPGREVCDGLDNDCDGEVDDENDDGYDAQSLPQVGLDCPDSGQVGACKPGHQVCEGGQLSCEPDIEPDTQVDTCDTPDVDEDCDGNFADEDTPDAHNYYLDMDGDGYGNDPFGQNPIYSCADNAADAGENLAVNWGDCDDSDPARSPGHLEYCDDAGVDENCRDGANEDGAQGSKRYYEDADGDGFGDPSTRSNKQCEPPAAMTNPVTTAGDCDDGDLNVNSGHDELCATVIDDDCDGDINEDDAADANTYYRDNDGDGYGSSNSKTACNQPVGYVAAGGDCNDSTQMTQGRFNDVAIGTLFTPAGDEICDIPDGGSVSDGHDNNCDGNIDEGCPTGEVSWDGGSSAAQFGYIGNQSATRDPGPYGFRFYRCPEGTVWSAARVNYFAGDTPVVWIEAGCQTFEATDNDSSPSDEYAENDFFAFVKNGAYGVTWEDDHTNNSGPNEAEFYCPSNSAIYKLEVESGAVVDRIKFHCRSYHPDAQSLADVGSSPADSKVVAYGGVGAPNSDSQQCPSGKVAVGFNVVSTIHRSKWSVANLQLQCADLQLETR